MLIRRETLDDAAGVFRVQNEAFTHEAGEVAAEATLVEELRAAGDSIGRLSLVAEVDGVLAGHVLGSRARIGELASLGLGPLGVLPRYQRLGVGSALVHSFLAAADALDFPEVVLLGDPRYYRRFGFRLAGSLGVVPPEPAWGEYFQVRTLSGWDPDRCGPFRYAPAFDSV